MHLIVTLAARSLLRSKLSLVLLTLAIAAGVGFQIPNAANLDGYTQELLRHGVLRDTGHLQLTPAPGAESIPRTAETLAAVKALPFVRSANPRLVHAGVLLSDGARHACRVVGIDPTPKERLCRHLGRGRCLTRGARGTALVGDRLATRLGLKVGDRVRAVLPVDDLDGVTLARLPLRVVGLLDSGGFSSGYDLVVSRPELSKLLEWGNEATMITVHVDDHTRADSHTTRVAAAAQAAAPGEPPVQVVSWRKANEFVTSAVEGNRTLFGISMTMVIVAVGIPVLALLYIHVLQERRQIAVFAALGFSGSDLFLIYLVKALLLGVAGVAAGIALGLGLCTLFTAYPIFDYQGFVVQPAVGPAVVALPAGILLTVTLLAGLAPAIRASRANPALELKEI